MTHPSITHQSIDHPSINIKIPRVKEGLFSAVFLKKGAQTCAGSCSEIWGASDKRQLASAEMSLRVLTNLITPAPFIPTEKTLI